MSGLIYFIACDPLEAVKIGFTAGEVSIRQAALQIGCPVKLRLIGTVFGTQNEERALHRRYASRRLSGEWFKISPNGRYGIDALFSYLDPAITAENGLLYGLGILERTRLADAPDWHALDRAA